MFNPIERHFCCLLDKPVVLILPALSSSLKTQVEVVFLKLMRQIGDFLLL